jgi:RNA polymerase sigma-70 factor (ECF subfamily)
VTPPATPAPDGRFEELFGATHARLDAAARRMLGNRQDADDVVQEVYLRAWKALPEFREESRHFTWLYAILTNAVRTFVGRRRHHVVPMADVDEPAEPEGVLHPEAFVEMQSLRDAMVAAVAELPACLRSVTERDLNGYRVADTADELGISVGTAKVRLHRARRALRERVA